MSNEEVMIPKSYHDKVCEEIIRFKDKGAVENGQ